MSIQDEVDRKYKDLDILKVQLTNMQSLVRHRKLARRSHPDDMRILRELDLQIAHSERDLSALLDQRVQDARRLNKKFV